MGNSAVADEVEGKYQAVANHLKEELTPLIDILERELLSLAYKLTEISREPRAQSSNFPEFAESYRSLQTSYDNMVMEYRRAYAELLKTMRQGLTDMVEYPIRDQYTEAARSFLSGMTIRILDAMTNLAELTSSVEAALREYKQNTQELANTVANTVLNHTYVDYAMDKLAEARNIDISPYITSFDIPEEYSNAIYSVRDKAMSGLELVVDSSAININALKRIHAEGAWAYKYWNVEQNIKTNLENIMSMILDIIEDELKEYQSRRMSNPITVWAPERGEIQADIPLPIDVKRLDELPDVSPLVEKVERFTQEVAATWESIMENISEMLPAEEQPIEADPVQELTQFKPRRASIYRQ